MKSFDVTKPLVCAFTHFRCEGTANLSLWGGGSGSIGMKPWGVLSLDRGGC